MVRRMIDAVDHRHVGKIKRLTPFKHATLTPYWFGLGAAAMVRVDAAPRAEVVLRRAGIEPVTPQRLFAGVECDAADIGRHCHRAAHPAIRTGTAAGGVESVGQFHSKAHGTGEHPRPASCMERFA
jgi:hypothetical protein